MPPCLVLTRPQASAQSFAQQAQAHGWSGEVLIAPLIEIRLFDLPDNLLDGIATLIATSRHAIAALAKGTKRRDMPLWTVGPGTAQAARAAGFRHVFEAGGDAKALLRDLKEAGVAGPFLHLRGNHVATDLVAALAAIGHQAQGCIVYAQDALPLSLQAQQRLQAGGDLVLAVFSPRSGALLAAQLQALDLSRAGLHLVAISTAATQPLEGLSLASRRIAAQPDADGMLAALAATHAALEPLGKPS